MHSLLHVAFWAALAAAFVRPPGMARHLATGVLLSGALVSGLMVRDFPPFCHWSLWAGVRPGVEESVEVFVVDAVGREHPYDANAIVPQVPSYIHHRFFGPLLMADSDEARRLGSFLLQRARAHAMGSSLPRWLFPGPGLWPVGPAPRQFGAPWPPGFGLPPAEITAVIARRSRLVVSIAPPGTVRTTIAERRFDR